MTKERIIENLGITILSFSYKNDNSIVILNKYGYYSKVGGPLSNYDNQMGITLEEQLKLNYYDIESFKTSFGEVFKVGGIVSYEGWSENYILNKVNLNNFLEFDIIGSKGIKYRYMVLPSNIGSWKGYYNIGYIETKNNAYEIY